MNSVNLYILCEGTKLDNWVDYQKVLTNSYEKKQLKNAEIDTLKRFVNELINKKPLDYIFSVEILNEGVDIVEVNQVIMLRPTQSPIIFIQQLGRGLYCSDRRRCSSYCLC